MVQRSALYRSQRELSNEYLLAKIGVDTAENEPLEVWGNCSILFNRVLIRRYLNFVWDVHATTGDTEEQVMEKLSPTLRSKLCVHIFGNVLNQCPFLIWMHNDPEAMKKLCLRVKSEFLEANDLLFSYGEMNNTVFILVKGWVTVCMGSAFNSDGANDEAGVFGLAERNL